MTTPVERQPLILLVEDDFVSAQLIQQMLIRSGFTVRLASTVNGGFLLALELRPDLILLDVLLPDGDGFTLCEAIKAEPSLTQIPIIFVTSLDDVESRIRGLSIGAVDFIQKPFAPEEVMARVRIHIKIARQTRKIAEVQSERLNALRDAQGLFNTDPATLPGAGCAVFYQPMEEAGGDQYDIIELGKHIYGFFVADIVGHGLETIFLATSLKTLFRENASLLDSPSETLYMINRSIRHHISGGQHMTAFYLIINRAMNRAYFSNAGHFPVLLVSENGSVSRLTTEGDVLGAFAEPRYQSANHEIPPGSRFWLYTDGILEDFNRGRTWKAGLELLERTVNRYHGVPLSESLDRVIREILPPGPAEDDRILLAVDG